MSKQEYFVDIHCHASYKAFNSGHPEPTESIWNSIQHNSADKGIVRLIRQQSQFVLKESQSDFTSLMNGKVRVVMVSLTPIEKGFLSWRRVSNMLLGNNSNEVIELLTGFSLPKIKYMVKAPDYYFSELVNEYNYIKNNQGKSPDGKRAYKIVNNYTELKDVVKNHPDTLAVIMSIEGGHLLGCGTEVSEKYSEKKLKEKLSENIQAIKNWEHPPFSLNLAHHFWNQLTGHARSFKGPVWALINQDKGVDKGLTEAGRHVIRELLSRKNGKRIIIDSKHLSIAARKEYYGFIRNYNYINPDDKIPVICSHTGMNGYKDMDSSIKLKDNNTKSRNQYLQKFSLNISAEEIRIIHESEGIIGLIMDKLVLGGGLAQQKIDKAASPAKKKKEQMKLFWTNIFQVVMAVKSVTAWDIISIGSDYDGAITHFDSYPKSEHMPFLKRDLTDFLEETNFKKELWYDYTPRQLTNKIFRKNAMAFYKKHFI